MLIGSFSIIYFVDFSRCKIIFIHDLYNALLVEYRSESSFHFSFRYVSPTRFPQNGWSYSMSMDKLIGVKLIQIRGNLNSILYIFLIEFTSTENVFYLKLI